jgi:nucleotide-binding universal stress UspA family protein
MFKRILCPIDGSDHSHKALDLAIDMAGKYDARLVIMHVPHHVDHSDALRQFAEIEGLSQRTRSELKQARSPVSRIGMTEKSSFDEPGIPEQLQIEIGQRIVDAAKGQALQGGLDKVDIRLKTGDPGDKILECIDEEKIDCVVMGSRGLNDLKGLFLGSVSHKVTSRAACTCIAVK